MGDKVSEDWWDVPGNPYAPAKAQGPASTEASPTPLPAPAPLDGGPLPPNHTAEELLALEAATAALVRLDCVLAGSSPAVAAGWTHRMAIEEAAASARLNGVLVDTADLRLLAWDSLDRAPDPDLAQALPLYDLVRRIAARHPRHLYTPRRLAALDRIRLARNAGFSLWNGAAEEVEAEERWAVLQAALAPDDLSRFRAAPALIGAAGFLAHWHRVRADRSAGAALGRLLAAWWPARQGLVIARRSGLDGPTFEGSDTFVSPTHPAFAGGPVLMPSIGFLGHAMEYRPDRHEGWMLAFLNAATRSLARGEALLRRLRLAEVRLAEALRPKRSTSRGPQVAAFLLAQPVVTSGRLAHALEMSGTAARTLLDGLHRDRLVLEISGRDAYRAYMVE
ncbi:hypothetical protein UAJ10_29455 [Nitrospirillum sp. BR 11164]|uniref:hypothetical protein n=1 Tax=Nitrospirillum sp. BR 11164 TaxID=3104324 RepID=UPI002AFE63FD|nr:hypothetical protein [Nitrospirillum sp. BR 11164]MEA1653131.1 hypothetical protein [Nitrospirillum sp. BR 11164]